MHAEKTMRCKQCEGPPALRWLQTCLPDCASGSMCVSAASFDGALIAPTNHTLCQLLPEQQLQQLSKSRHAG